MGEKRNYVVYCTTHNEDIERVIHTTQEKADAIQWFIDTFDIDGTVELAEKYIGEEI